MAWIMVAREEAIPAGSFLRVTVGARDLALFNVAGRFCCIEDLCTHDGGTLVEGDFDGREVTCPRHGARFDVCTGEALCLPAVAAVPVFPVRVREGAVEILVGNEPG